MTPSDRANARVERQKLALQYAVEARKFEIEHFWKRSVYFWGLVAAALVAYANLDAASDASNRTIVLCFGFLTSVAWSLQSRGSKYWQEAWEQKVNKAQISPLGFDLFNEKEPFLPRRVNKRRRCRDAWLRSRGYSVSKLAIAMSDMSVLLWLAIAMATSNLCLSADFDKERLSYFLGTAIFAAGLLCFGRSTRQPPDT